MIFLSGFDAKSGEGVVYRPRVPQQRYKEAKGRDRRRMIPQAMGQRPGEFHRGDVSFIVPMYTIYHAYIQSMQKIANNGSLNQDRDISPVAV
jgi:hypothetical protein